MQHPLINRRVALQAGAIGLLGLGSNHVSALRAESSKHDVSTGKAKSCIYIFLSGGLSQHESFDLKPDAPEEIRGEFRPIATQTPGLQICEHLPMLAARSETWAICRSLSHGWNEHSQGHHIMLTGRSDIPRGFSPSAPKPTDHPSIAAVANAVSQPRNNLPPVAVLPEKLVHRTGRVIPGQFAGSMGARRDPWLIEAAGFHTSYYGAFPEYSFDHQERGGADSRTFEAPNLTLPHGLNTSRVHGQLELQDALNKQRRKLEQAAHIARFDRHRESAISLLTDARVHRALDVTRADEDTQTRYGKNAFGWSLLMARRLVSSGVNLVQVNLGNNETWDTHGNAFPHLRDNLLPPTDRAVSALLDDLRDSGQLDETLVVMAGEFGRTPKISLLPKHYKSPGRDHWGALQSVFFAGGGVKGGQVIGESDKIGAYPVDNMQKPENFAATIFQSLGIPRTAAWYDQTNRPHFIYHSGPIAGLIG